MLPDEDEQQIFNTINSLGVRLTTAELLKNHFFNRDQIDDYEKYWKVIFEKDKEERSFWDRVITTGRFRRTMIDLFFHAYFQIKVNDPQYDVRSEAKQEYTRVDHLFESYKHFLKEHRLKFVITHESSGKTLMWMLSTNKFPVNRVQSVLSLIPPG